MTANTEQATRLLRGLGGRDASEGHPPPSRPRAAAPDASQQGRPALRRRPLGQAARQEHDAFADALAERGVEVLLLERLLAETSRTPPSARTSSSGRSAPRPEADAQSRGTALARVDDRRRGGALADRRRRVGRASVREPSRSQRSWQRRDDGFALPPLPNHMFTRDTSAWIYGGVTVNAMAKPARARESIHLRRDLQAPSALRRPRLRVWSDGWACRRTLRAATSS